MSCLKLYAPEELDQYDTPVLSVFDPEEEPPQVLSWRMAPTGNGRPSLIEMITRSRLLHRHRLCRCCGRPTVRPVEKEDGEMGKNRLPIPGTATLVGFQCDYCDNQWTV